MKKKTPKFGFRRKPKEDHNISLLADSDVRQPSDFQRIDESRNEENATGDPWLLMPYQIAKPEVPKPSLSNREVAETSRAVGQPAEVSRADDSNRKLNNVARKNKPKLSTLIPPPPPSRSKARASVRPRVLSKKITNESSEDDVFDDLESVRDRVIAQVDSLEDIMDDKSISKSIDKKNTFTSFQIDAESSDASDHQRHNSDRSSIADSFRSSSTGSEDLPIDPLLMKKRGILIVDPQNNGEIYRMDEQNKNLIDKDLIITGYNRTVFEDDDDDDDETLMSVLTEVTYQRSKEERMKHIVQNLKDAAAIIPESRAWCGIFQCPAGSMTDKFIEGNDKQADESKKDRNVSRIGKPSVTQNIQMIYKSLCAATSKEGYGKKVEVGDFSESIVVCITRIYLSLQEGGIDNGLRCTYNEPKLCHDLGVHLTEASDGRAVVVDVRPESTAERSGVKIGDVLSFAVPLNNTFQGYEKACDFISRLELIGMRTSYREIFDMFLSKTSSGWPVATVFRKGSMGVRNFEEMPFGLPSVDMNIDLSRASSFFHEIVTRCREYDYHLECNGVYEIVRGNIETFVPKPHCRSRKMKNFNARRIDVIGETAKSFGLETSREARSILLPKISEENFHQPMFFPESRRSSLLTWYTENSEAIVYIKLTGTFGGTGVTVARIKEGSWSAPCAITANVNGCSISLHADPVECVIFVRDIGHLDALKKGKQIVLGGDEQKESILVVTKIADVFCAEADMRCTLSNRTDLNSLFYSSNNGGKAPTSEMILEGKLQSPAEAIVFGGALRRLELPSTMYPHPTPPKNLIKFNGNDWTAESSCKSPGNLDPPFDDNTISTLRQLFETLEQGESLHEEELNEFEVFAQKFKQMLYDGVTIDRAWPTEEGNGGQDSSFTTKVTLKLDRKTTSSGKEDCLLFVAKSRVAAVGSTCDFSCPADLPKNKCLSESLDMLRIVKISQSMPQNFVKKSVSLQEARKRRKRFVSLKTKDGKRVPFLARTGKDASLLACGLKLLVERSRQHGW